jgi:hypothetical protein
MKDEYDFSKAERGRFFRPGAILVSPAPQQPSEERQSDIATTKAGEPVAKSNINDTLWMKSKSDSSST